LAELGQDIGFAPRDAREQCASDTGGRQRDVAEASHALRSACGWPGVIGSHARPSRASRRSAAAGPVLPAA